MREVTALPNSPREPTAKFRRSQEDSSRSQSIKSRLLSRYALHSSPSSQETFLKATRTQTYSRDLSLQLTGRQRHIRHLVACHRRVKLIRSMTIAVGASTNTRLNTRVSWLRVERQSSYSRRSSRASVISQVRSEFDQMSWRCIRAIKQCLLPIRSTIDKRSCNHSFPISARSWLIGSTHRTPTTKL